MPRPPEIATWPESGVISPQIMRINVVLPEPLAPTNATLAPSPTRKLTSLSNTRPSESEYSTAFTSMWPTLVAHSFWVLATARNS